MAKEIDIGEPMVTLALQVQKTKEPFTCQYQQYFIANRRNKESTMFTPQECKVFLYFLVIDSLKDFLKSYLILNKMYRITLSRV